MSSVFPILNIFLKDNRGEPYGGVYSTYTSSHNTGLCNLTHGLLTEMMVVGYLWAAS